MNNKDHFIGTIKQKKGKHPSFIAKNNHSYDIYQYFRFSFRFVFRTDFVETHNNVDFPISSWIPPTKSSNANTPISAASTPSMSSSTTTSEPPLPRIKITTIRFVN